MTRDPREPSLAGELFLALVVALYVGAALVHAFRAPVGATGYQDAPDQQAHVIAARVIASGRLPTLQNPGSRQRTGAPLMSGISRRSITFSRED